MSRIVIDEEQRANLNGMNSATEVTDASGKLLGYFISPESFTKLTEVWDKFVDADIAELDRRAGEDTYTLAEIWKELGVQ